MQLVLDYSYKLAPYQRIGTGRQGVFIFERERHLYGPELLAMEFNIDSPGHNLDRLGPDVVAQLIKKLASKELQDFFATPWMELCHPSEFPDEPIPKLPVRLVGLRVPRTHKLNGKKYLFN